MNEVEHFDVVKEYKNIDNDLKVCANCRWWEVSENEFEKHGCLAEGWCHRYPPNVPCVSHINDIGIMVPEEPSNGIPLMSHPSTFAEDWCGEFSWAANLRWTE